ncbi:C-GCAxxG-C-C family (seleno)protein [Clostridium luticellarii]|jgi:C_GCAxxG_C_C family probable redox protein|uniref:C-GCAxxG-C-C family (seleno)protein n=1 Tax=Clostridium luticellarii TaxID=1691940 RepID=UPI002357B4E8|nr:C-GCAxxG-C-C family (seleno)protein [Clostridium luticellarii]MCI1945511.1 C-GCAxxG-C-C family protein [Clostridium luticellarii]MCI1969410.1 C-GCAxxG-C-C family protein [Clostridium luticellarii]
MTLQKKKLATQAVDLFKGGLYCSEAILQVFNRELDLKLNDTAIKMSTGFGAGLGASKCCCGSLTGAVLVLSAVKGRTSAEEDVDEVFALTKKLHDEFKRKFNATCCRILTKSVKWGQPEHHENCEKIVAGAVEILVDILNESSNENIPQYATQKNA